MPEIYIEPATGNFTSAYRAANLLPMILWDNLATRDTLGAGYVNMVDNNTIDFWESPNTSNHNIWVENIGQARFSCVALFRHNLATAGVEISIHDGVSPVTSWFTPQSDRLLIIIFPDAVANNRIGLQYRNATTPPIIYNLFVGQRMVIPSGIDGSGFDPIEFSTSSELVQNQSLSGNLIGNYIVKSGVNVDLPFNFVEQDFIYDKVKGFAKHYNSGKPFFMASSPSLLPNDAAFLWRGGDMGDMDISLIDNRLYGTFSVPATGAME